MQVLFTRNCAYDAANFFADQWEGCELRLHDSPVPAPSFRSVCMQLGGRHALLHKTPQERLHAGDSCMSPSGYVYPGSWSPCDSPRRGSSFPGYHKLASLTLLLRSE